MKEGIMGLLIGSAMLFASPAFSTEMIRYEHEIYASGGGEQAGYEVSRDEQYVEYQQEQERHATETKDKEGHPIFIAFPDRD